MSRPQHQKVVRLRLVPAAIGVGAALALTGCSAGQVTQTDTQVAAVNGASGQAGPVTVRNAEFSFPSNQPYYPVGSSVPVEVVLANNGTTGDQLVEVRSEYAGSAEISGWKQLPSDSSLHAYGSSQGNQPGVEGAPSDRREVQVTLTDLQREIGPGVTAPVTFVFEKAGPVTVQVPIGADPAPRPNPEEPHH